MTNMEALGSTIMGRMNQTAEGRATLYLALGTLNSDLSLTVDSIGTPIPKGDYMVSLHLTHDTYFTYNELNSSQAKPHQHKGPEAQHAQASGTGMHVHTSDGLHTHRVPSVFRNLEPGDRVLVCWPGKEPVVVDIVVSSDKVTHNEGVGAE